MQTSKYVLGDVVGTSIPFQVWLNFDISNNIYDDIGIVIKVDNRDEIKGLILRK